MNRGQIITQIGYRIRTASRNFVTSDEIINELDRSLDRLNAIIDLDNTRTSTTVAFTGDGDFSGPTDLKKPISLYDRTNNMLYKQMSREELYEVEDGVSQTTVVPTTIITPANAYAITYNADGTVDLSIESVVDSATLTFTYYSTNDAKTSGGTKQKGMSADTDEPLLSARFHDYFVWDVASQIFWKERKFDDFQLAQGERDKILERIFDQNQTREDRIVTLIQAPVENWE